MTRRLILHIGNGKTGSSAIQSWLSAHAGVLRAEHGIHYADLAPEAKHGRVTSGNAKAFVHLCVPQRRPEGYTRDGFLEALERVYFAGADTCIASSEGLSSAPAENVAELKSMLDSAGISVMVVAFVRSIYDHCWSCYHQAVKRHGCYGTFEEFAATYDNPQVRALRAWGQMFRGLRVVNYDACQERVVNAFLSACGIAREVPDAMASARVNRSLTGFELELMRMLNRTAARNKVRLGRSLCNALLEDSPNEESCFLYDRRIMANMESRFAPDVKWVNDTFPMQAELTVDSARPQTRGMHEGEIPRAYGVTVDALVKHLQKRSKRRARARRRARKFRSLVP